MIKRKYRYTAFILLVVLCSCSRTTLNLKKNTWSTRFYQTTVSKFNIYFNGDEAYNEGVDKINTNHADDYTQVLPVFEDTDHETYKLANKEMNYAIEKANKIIQLHSIKLKPQYNAKKMRDPEYREWASGDEFNKMVDDSYILLGKSRFYLGEFMEAIGVFNYVTTKFADQDIWYLANLWIARSYLEMGWLYEAENILNLINVDNFPFKYEAMFFAVNADFHIKKGNYNEAIPFLESALEAKITKKESQRYRYILAQIHQKNGENLIAYKLYHKVVSSIPEYEMEFNARICMSEVMVSEEAPKAIRKLERMLKDPKNLEYKGEIYYAIGNAHSTIGESDLAIENYRLSIAFSKGIQNGVTSHTIAELYWNNKDYRKAAPYYAMAASSLPENYPKSYEIKFRSENLALLDSYYSTIGEQHREYLLSQMNEDDKRAFLLKERDEAEREIRINELIAEAKGESAKEIELQSERNVEKGGWYFYNADLKRKGKDEFRNQWGERQLRDNWRRSMATDFGDSNIDAEEAEVEEDSTPLLAEDSISTDTTTTPVTIDEINYGSAGNTVIENYFNLATLYQFDIQDYAKALEIYQALEAQYPQNNFSADCYFAIYNYAIEQNDKAEANRAKSIIFKDYPDSRYALILSDPNAKTILNEDKVAYNTLYEETFALFQAGKNYDVLNNTDRLKNEFRDTTLQAKVLLMEALVTGKTNPNADTKAMLENIKNNYPKDKEVQMQVDILIAQLAEGKTIALGGSAANALAERRNKQAEVKRQEILKQQQYKYEPQSRHYMVLLLDDSCKINTNHLQYDLSRFNFNKFLTMDFDLNFGKLNNNISLLTVNGFSNEEEGKWYLQEILSTNMPNKYKGIIKWYIISEENFRLMLMLQSYDEYEIFSNIKQY